MSKQEEQIEEILANLVSDDLAEIVLGMPKTLDEAKILIGTKKEINNLVAEAAAKINKLLTEEKIRTLQWVDNSLAIVGEQSDREIAHTRSVTIIVINEEILRLKSELQANIKEREV